MEPALKIKGIAEDTQDYRWEQKNKRNIKEERGEERKMAGGECISGEKKISRRKELGEVIQEQQEVKLGGRRSLTVGDSGNKEA